MYTYKCYYHPKDDGEQSCRGCKLPVCTGCQGLEGFCPECDRKRAAVQQLKQLRQVMAAHPTATTTGRLRLARRAAADGALSGSRKLAASGALGPKTRPLQPPPRAASTALPQAPQGPLRPSRQTPERPQERRYNGDGVAYKPVASRTEKPVASRPEKAVAARTDRYVKPRKAPGRAPARASQAVRPAWFTPFMVGLGVGVMLVVVMLLAQPFMRGPAQPAQQATTELTAREEAFLDRALSAQRVDIPATPRARAAAPARVAAPASRPAARRYTAAAGRRLARPAARPQGKRRPTLEEAMVFHTVHTP